MSVAYLAPCIFVVLIIDLFFGLVGCAVNYVVSRSMKQLSTRVLVSCVSTWYSSVRDGICALGKAHTR